MTTGPGPTEPTPRRSENGATAPEPRVDSALPSQGARVLAFASILVAGLCGGLIGLAFTELQCTGECTVPMGFGTLVGAGIAAGGVAVVAVLVLRAMGEWRTIRQQDQPRR